MKRMLVFLLLSLLLVPLTGCGAFAQAGTRLGMSANNVKIQFTMPGANPEIDKPGENEHVAGFATGLWHGLISEITVFVSFFNPAIQMYEVHNDGALYNLGFLLGTIFLFGVLGFAGGRRS